MKTEIISEPAQPVAGRKVKTHPYNIRNFRVHQPLEILSKLMIFMVECDSNNTNGIAKPRDTAEILSAWQIIKDEFQFSVDNDQMPAKPHEFAFMIELIQPVEIQRCTNMKVRRALSEMFVTAEILKGIDSANSQDHISEKDEQDVKSMFQIVDRTIARWLGDGTTKDTGVAMPDFKELGTIEPALNKNYAQMLEPSSARPAAATPDTPDVD